MDSVNAPGRLRTLPSWLLGQAAAEARRVVTEALRDEGVHRSQYALMAAVAEFGSVSQSELSARSGLDRSDVVRWVDELATGGFLERAQDQSDRRRNVLFLTASGQQLLTRLDRRLAAAQQELLKSLSPVEQAGLVDLLGRLLTREPLGVEPERSTER